MSRNKQGDDNKTKMAENEKCNAECERILMWIPWLTQRTVSWHLYLIAGINNDNENVGVFKEL